MIWVDYFILGVVLLSGLLSLWRGFVKEALSLLTWIAAPVIAILFYEDFAPWFERWVSVPSARLALAFGILLVLVLILGGLVNYLVGQLVSKTGLTGTDRALGIVFGIARGVMVVGVLVLLAGLTQVPQDPWWQESVFLKHFVELALWMRSFLPTDIAENIQY
ncbi:MAG: CvpA family protein [Gammaproteobacteria bacterium]|nr:CvpA family protein [Gammaproteobacteria bacterium]MCW9058252.1 CvpA family protein [Gammaproteobacteria bacterium]